MEDVKIPFTFDSKTGTLSFNLDHPDWSTCEDSDATLIKYQLQVITTALSLELFRNGNGELGHEVVEFAHKQLREQVFAIMNGDAMLKKEVLGKGKGRR